MASIEDITKKVEQDTELIDKLEKRIIHLESRNIKVPRRKLGKNGPEVSIIGLGCMGMSGFYTTNGFDEEESLKTIKRALDAGIDHFDTADIYGSHGTHFGHNEELLGKAIKKFGREKFFIATKFACTPNGKLCGKSDYVKKACEDSLKRLGIDFIDLYTMHRLDPETPIEETVKAMAQLVKEGKVKYLGLSEVNSETIRKANSIHTITAVQSEYSAWTNDVESILPTLRELGISLVGYSPLGRGFLAGAFKSKADLDPKDWRHTVPRFAEENFDKNLKLVEEIEKLAREKKM